MEVCPFSLKSRLLKEARAVNIISRHQPVRPHFKKFFNNSFIILTVLTD